ncbi:hypothetical protein IKQ02_01855, partial [bacterium]|nr:hypothetical protein [bacterium]
AVCSNNTSITTTTTTTTTTKEDINKVTKEVWNKYVTDFGFMEDENLNYTLTVYEDDDTDASEIIKKDGNSIHYEMIISETSFLRYLDFSELKTNNRFVGYMYFDNDANKWYKSYSTESIDVVANIIRFYARPKFEDVTYENGLYSYTFKDVYEADCTMTFKFENNVLVQYESFDDEESRIVKGVFSDIGTTKVTLPEAYFIDDMPMNAMLDYIKDFSRTLQSYRKITVKNYEVNDCYAGVRFDYEVIHEDENENDDIEAIIDGIYSLIVKRQYENRVELIKQESPVNDYVWAAQFKNGNKNYLIIKLDKEDPYDITFSIVNEVGLDMFGFKVYLEEAFDEYDFSVDNTYFISNSECMIVKYTLNIHEDSVDNNYNFIKTVFDDYNGLEWKSTSSDILPIYSHSEIYSNENMAAKFVVGDSDENGILHFEIYCCVTFNGSDPYSLLSYGYKPLMP